MRNILLFLGLLAITQNASAQLVGTNIYLQGAYVEIGQTNNGSLGACNTAAYGIMPAGYHPHLPGTGALAEVYDYGHDGWTTGAPPFMGDYTYPGSPFEGWGIQVNGVRGQGYQTCPGNITCNPGWLTGSNTGYSNTGGRAIGIWNGSAVTGGLQIRQETRVDTLASWVVFTVTLKNTTAAPLTGVYYWRSCDPDNDQSWPGGAFSTNNLIVYQNDIQHRVLVRAIGQLGPNAYMGLGTKDCRARCCVYSSWGLTCTQDLGAVWSGTYVPGSTLYTPGQTNTADVGIGLTYNIGTIPANDSAIISYAYIFSNNFGLDSAFPDPQLVLNGVPRPVVAPPAPNFDTFNTCDYPGLSVLPVDIRFGSDKSWSWSKWTWSPGVGLASTTGVTNTINISSLPGTTTYTITGTDSATGMASCNTKVFYLTVIPCNLAANNSPCEGDTLKLWMNGDSVGATYKWYGPMPSTTIFATTRTWSKFPAALSDSGLYFVIKTFGGVSDTDSTRVVIHPKPILNVTSNMPMCAPIAPNLNLSVTPFTPGETFSWTGPNSFTSTLQFPSIVPFALIDTGTYTVIGTTAFGCKDTGSTFVYPGTVAGYTYVIHHGCDEDTVIFANTSTNGNVFTWNFSDGTPLVTTTTLAPVTHIFAEHKPYNVTITSANVRCTDNHAETVNTSHTVTADFSANNDTICIAPDVDATTMVDLSTATVAWPAPGGGLVTAWDWDFGDGSAHDFTAGPVHTYTAPGIYPVTLTVTDSIGCQDSKMRTVVVVEPTITAATDTTLCLLQPMELITNVTVNPNIAWSNFTYAWTPATNLSATDVKTPLFFGYGDFTYTVTVTMPGYNCTDDHVVTIHSVLGAKLQNVTKSSTLPYGSSIQMFSSNELHYTWTPNDGSLNDANINNPVATPSVTTTYTVYGMDQYGCVDSANVTITVDSTMNEFVPSGFTPNGDGLNDVFRPTFLKYQKLVEFNVFNRWGQRIFTSSNKDYGWDGTYNGVPQDMGVYHYQIITSRAGHSDNQVYKGDVTLIR
ncbi:MAG: PKD domain-containing protein [Bacteroidota bacterium]